MTPSMILWTLDLLDWVREQLAEQWPGARLRGGETDIDPEPYRIRFRDNGKQYWMVLSPSAIRATGVADVISLLERSDWIPSMKETGGILVDLQDHDVQGPALVPWPAPGPEVKAEATA